MTSTVCFLKSLGVSASILLSGSKGYPKMVPLHAPPPPFWYPQASAISFFLHFCWSMPRQLPLKQEGRRTPGLTVKSVSVVLPQSSRITKSAVLGVVQPWNSFFRSCLKTTSETFQYQHSILSIGQWLDSRLDIEFCPVDTASYGSRG
jgi:hypothetical protein